MRESKCETCVHNNFCHAVYGSKHIVEDCRWYEMRLSVPNPCKDCQKCGYYVGNKNVMIGVPMSVCWGNSVGRCISYVKLEVDENGN